MYQQLYQQKNKPISIMTRYMFMLYESRTRNHAKYTLLQVLFLIFLLHPALFAFYLQSVKQRNEYLNSIIDSGEYVQVNILSLPNQRSVQCSHLGGSGCRGHVLAFCQLSFSSFIPFRLPNPRVNSTQIDALFSENTLADSPGEIPNHLLVNSKSCQTKTKINHPR